MSYRPQYSSVYYVNECLEGRLVMTRRLYARNENLSHEHAYVELNNHIFWPSRRTQSALLKMAPALKRCLYMKLK